MFQLNLPVSTQQPPFQLRELCGRHELLVTANNTADVLRLLSKLVVTDTVEPNNAMMPDHWPVAIRDYVLAGIYQRYFGDKIESTLPCNQCEEPMDVSFALSELANHLWEADTKRTSWRKEDGSFLTEDGIHFRLPVGADELAITNLTAEAAKTALLERCLLTDSKQTEITQLEKVMAQAAPLLETNLTMSCAECQHQQEVYFNMQAYFLNTLLQQRRQLLYEVHQIAMHYHWSRTEILDLSRTERKMYLNFLMP